jgi:hypothetical protein
MIAALSPPSLSIALWQDAEKVVVGWERGSKRPSYRHCGEGRVASLKFFDIPGNLDSG